MSHKLRILILQPPSRFVIGKYPLSSFGIKFRCVFFFFEREREPQKVTLVTRNFIQSAQLSTLILNTMSTLHG